LDNGDQGLDENTGSEVRFLRSVKCWNIIDLIVNGDIWTELGIYVGLEVLTAAVLKNSVFQDITPCSPVKVSGHLEGTCRLHLQGRIISQERNQSEAGDKQTHNELHGVITWKTELFTTGNLIVGPKNRRD
jgi:hypothetical protein